MQPNRTLWLSVVCLLGLVLVSGASFAQLTRYVSTTGTTPAASATTSWATSTTDLQGAINASQPGDQVWVAAGIYKPTSTTARNVSFSMLPGVKIYGGFVGSETVLGSRLAINPVSGNPSSSTLSGDIGTVGNASDNSYHVILNDGNGLTNTAVLDGFVITGGNANGSEFDPNFPAETDYMGGAVVNNRSSSPTLANCSFISNQASQYGGAIANNRNCSPMLINCSFQSNQATDWGGAILNQFDSNPTLTNCSFEGNQAGIFGGAITNAISNPTLTNCVLQSNTANYGGGIANIIGNPTLTNCSLLSNQATTHGGGLYSKDNSNPTLTNCLMANNQATSNGGVIYNENSISQLINCSLQSNQAGSAGGVMYNFRTFFYNGSSTTPTLINCSLRDNKAQQGGAIVSQNNSANPINTLLVNSILWSNGNTPIVNNPTSTASSNFCLFDAASFISGPGSFTTATSPFAGTATVALAPCSPAIDAGSSVSYTAAGGPSTDLAGNTRTVGPSIDMGAIEFQGAKYPTRLYVAASQTATSGGDGLTWATAFKDLQRALTYPCSQSLTEVWVATGIYKPTSTTARDVSFAMRNNLAIIGGFVGSETTVSARPAINPVSGRPSSSTLSGEIGDPASTTDNSYHVIKNPASLTTTAVLDGFVITGGNANGSANDSNGGGVYNDGINTGTNPRFLNCAFLRNSAISGGAMFNYTNSINSITSPQLINCIFQSNSAINGGAMYNYGLSSGIANPQLTNCAFQSNSATSGGAIYNYSNADSRGSSPRLTNCSFQSNSATSGGAIYNFGRANGRSIPQLINVSCVAM